jgi:hypothetical protein
MLKAVKKINEKACLSSKHSRLFEWTKVMSQMPKTRTMSGTIKLFFLRHCHNTGPLTRIKLSSCLYWVFITKRKKEIKSGK